MDNEALVDQIVRSLSFEVVAIPENIIAADSTPESTPLNVKIKVRKKSDAALRHGVLSMPKVETITESQKDAVPERIRLVSSDQTIMNLKMLVEADLEKNIAHEKHKLKLNAITPGSEIRHNEGKNAEVLHTSPALAKRNKDFFGRSKPGGCLDPPYGEDKYSYQPTTRDSHPPKEESTKLRSSSIFKNSIFKKKRKSSLTSDQFTDLTNVKELDTKYSNETDSLQTSTQYSNSIITYPHISDACELYREKEMSREEEPSYKKRHSNDEKLKNCSIDDSSYFIMQKKSKSFSNQSDPSKMQKINTKCTENKHSVLRDESKLVDKNILDQTKQPERVDNKTAESVLIASTSSIPIPLMVTLKSTINDRKENVIKHEEITIENNSVDCNSALKYTDTNHKTRKIYKQVDELETYDTQTAGDQIIEKVLPEIKNITAVDEISNTKDVNGPQILKIVKSAQNIVDNIKTLSNSVVTVIIDDVTILKNAVNSKPVISESHLATEKKNSVIISEAINHPKDNINSFENCSETLVNPNSFPLVTRTRERSMLNVTTDLAKEMLTQKEISSLMLLEHDKFTYLLSTEEISQIWENETEPLKSMADVIFSETVPVIKDVSNLSTEKFSERVQSISYFKSDDKTNSISRSANRPNFHGKDNLNDGEFDNKEKKIDNINGDIKIPSINSTSEIKSTKKIYIQDKSPVTHISNNDRESVTQENVLQPVEKSPIDTEIADNFGNLSNNKLYTIVDTDKAELINKHKDLNKNLIKLNSESDKISSQATTLISISDIYNNEERGIMQNNKTSNASILEKTSVTTDDLISGFESKCLSHETSDKESDNAYSKSCPNIGIEPIAILQDIESDNMLDNVSIIQSPRLFPGKETPQLKNVDNASHIAFQVDQFSSKDLLKQPSIRKSVILWKMDIAMQSYTNKNYERVIKSFDSDHTPPRQLNDKFLVTRCYMDSDTNEIKIPVDENNDFSLKIIQTKYESRSLAENSYGFGNTAVESHGDKKIQIKVPVSEIKVEDYKKSTDYEDLSKSEAGKDNKDIINADLRNALNRIYEEELVPLQDVIKGLREEIDALAVYQLKFKEKVLKPVSKRSRPIRLVHPNKRCACLRRF